MESIETFTLTQLSLDVALGKVSPSFRNAYRWFEANESRIFSPLPVGKLAPEDIGVTLSQPQRGIHKPAYTSGYSDYALSIRVTKKSGYADTLFDQGDGTWILWYSEQEKNPESKKTHKEIYNQALLDCWRDGVPVGVFVQIAEKKAAYECKGLAFIEKYDPQRGLFKLHGPVRSDQDDDFWSLYEVDAVEEELAEEDLDDDDADERRSELVYRAIRQRQDAFRRDLITAYKGQCAVTAYDVEETLQAAHISSYRGPKSQKVSNGLLLRADIHLLYDAHLASVEPDTMKFMVAPKIEESAYGDLNGQMIRLPYCASDRPSEPRLATHFAEFRMKHEI